MAIEGFESFFVAFSIVIFDENFVQFFFSIEVALICLLLHEFLLKKSSKQSGSQYLKPRIFTVKTDLRFVSKFNLDTVRLFFGDFYGFSDF